MTTALIILCAALPLGDAEFLRGDVNSDGTVSVSDGHYLLSYLFRGFATPECMDSADFTDDKGLNITDEVHLIDFVIRGEPAPPPPFGTRGADPTPDSLDCLAYGSGAPLEDASAVLEVLDSTAEPAGEEGKARITIAVSNSTQIGGYQGRIRLPPGVAAGVELIPRDLSGTHDSGFMLAALHGDSIRFAFLSSIVGMGFISPGESVRALELTVCLQEGLPSGEYPLVLEGGELTDFRSGRAIPPRLVSATLTVARDVASGTDCDPEPNPERVPVNAVFKLEDVTAPPGGAVTVPFVIRADAEVHGYSFSVDFDETLLQAMRIEPVWQKPAGTDPEYDFSVYHMNNNDQVPGSAGVDEGFMVGAVVFALTEWVTMPSNTDNLALRFHLGVKPNAPDGTTEVRFLDGGRHPGTPHPIENFLAAMGQDVTPSVAESFLLIDCLLQILPDGALFIRGDSNRDGRVNVSDPVNTLGHLFFGTGPLDCSDAADANDDGVLNLSDAIMTLEFLFLGLGVLPPPQGDEGTDPTTDELYCFSRA